MTLKVQTRLILVLGLPLSVAACGSSDATSTAEACLTGGSGGSSDAATDTAIEAAAGTGGQGGSDAAPEAEPDAAAALELHWQGCAFVPGEFAECAKTQVPLDWDKPDGPKISYFIKRMPAKQQPARGQVWLLQGGPGYSDATIQSEAPLFSAMADDLDVYLPDHRGTGYSEKLVCSSVEKAYAWYPDDIVTMQTAMQTCVDALKSEYGDGLAHFSAADAARDIGELIQVTAKPGEQVYIYGVSYGTRWAHRYLQQFPNQATGVILDSVMGEDFDFLKYDQNVNAGAKRILDACSADAFCQGKLGTDAWSKAQAIVAKLDTAGYCETTSKLTKADYRMLLASVAQTNDFESRAILAPILYRLDRCDSTDQKVIADIWDSMTDNTVAFSQYASYPLQFQVSSSELTATPAPTLQDLQAQQATYMASIGFSVLQGAAKSVWPAYSPEPWLGAHATTSTTVAHAQRHLRSQDNDRGGCEFRIALHRGPPNVRDR